MIVINKLFFFLLNYDENRTNGNLIPVNILNSFTPSEISESKRRNIDKQFNDQVWSNQISPSSADRSTVTNRLQQNIISSPASRINKRTQIGRKFGEETTDFSHLSQYITSPQLYISDEYHCCIVGSTILIEPLHINEPLLDEHFL